MVDNNLKYCTLNKNNIEVSFPPHILKGPLGTSKDLHIDLTLNSNFFDGL
jgi:hypothetical protein